MAAYAGALGVVPAPEGAESPLRGVVVRMVLSGGAEPLRVCRRLWGALGFTEG